MKRAALLISHGSRLLDAKKEVRALTKLLKQKTKIPIFECAFLEINHPDISEGIRICVKKGAQEITILQNFLNSGNHVRKDIPRIVESAKKEFPHVRFRLTIPIGQHKKIPALFAAVLKESKIL